MSDLFDSWDIFDDSSACASPLSNPYAFDGSDSPQDVTTPAPRSAISRWDASAREWRIVISRHPISEARLRRAFRETEKTFGQIHCIAAFIERGFGDLQTITVLKHLGFIQSHARAASHAVCYVKDLKRQKTEPPRIPTPVQEPKGWAKELTEFRTRLEYKKLRGTLTEADNQELRWYEIQVEKEQNAARSESVQAIDAEILELQKQIDALKRQKGL